MIEMAPGIVGYAHSIVNPTPSNPFGFPGSPAQPACGVLPLMQPLGVRASAGGFGVFGVLAGRRCRNARFGAALWGWQRTGCTDWRRTSSSVFAPLRGGARPSLR